ncbi:MAG: helix-turn-helix domain-containing protein [Thermoplasmata archaeon]|nr:helix-turn-helix domain-containing protein [Thermoplasmata archaeon]
MKRFTQDHPDLVMMVLDRLEISPRQTLFEVRVEGPGSFGASEWIGGYAGVRRVERLSQESGAETCQVVFNGPTLIPRLKETRLVRQFPFPVEDGVATWTVLGPERRVRELLRRLEADGRSPTVVSLRTAEAASAARILTPRQHEILRQSIREGYFDVPRRISLTALAPKLGVAVSTLSVTLAVIEKKVVEQHPEIRAFHGA